MTGTTHDTATASSTLGRLEAALKRRIAWLTDERRDLLGTPTAIPALIVVLGREHYTERRRNYPIHSRRDLEAVLAQELAQAPDTLALIGDPEQDKREVSFFELRPGVLEKVGSALWLLPESALLARTLPAGRVASIERDRYRYFLSASGASQPAGGMVATPELFALAIGLAAGQGALQLDREAAVERLTRGMRALPPSAWLRLRRPSRVRQSQVEWRSVAMVAGAGLAAYLALASGYLLWTRDAREQELEALGAEVETLLAAQRQVDRLAAQRAGLGQVWRDRADTYQMWRIAGLAWGKGAQLTAIELKDFELTLRGKASVATDVLAALDQAPGVKEAKFSAPVRSGRDGLEEFVISLTLVREAQGG